MTIIKKLLVFVSSTLILHSCIDIEEIITIKEDNSGTYSFNMDMGGMLEFAKTMGSDNEKKEKKKRDTLIYFKDMMTGETDLTPQEKELYKDATAKVKLDEGNAEMKMQVQCPFQKIEQLPEIKENLFKIAKRLKVFDKIADKENKEATASEEDMADEKMISPGAGAKNEFIAKPGKVSFAILNSSDYKKELMGDSSAAMMQQMTALMGEIKYKTTIITPKPVKKYNGNAASLSADKRSVSFITNFTEMMEAPEKLGYLVEY